jgi:hypothetical protein
MQVMAGRKRVESASQEHSFACFGFSTSCHIVCRPLPAIPFGIISFQKQRAGSVGVIRASL